MTQPSRDMNESLEVIETAPDSHRDGTPGYIEGMVPRRGSCRISRNGDGIEIGVRLRDWCCRRIVSSEMVIRFVDLLPFRRERVTMMNKTDISRKLL